MARPRSEEKRLALLNAAAEAVAEHGLAAAPTSLIAKKAGVAEGTLYRYFSTKDELLNELYLHITQDMCRAMEAQYVSTDTLRQRAQSLWDSYIDWGMNNVVANKALNQLEVSEVVTPETLAKGRSFFPGTDICNEFSGTGVFAELSEAFTDAIFLALADVTMDFANRYPKQAKRYKASGFEVMWTMYKGE